MRDARIGRVAAWSYTVPTDAPEADGTLEWDRTTLVVAEVEAGGRVGLGYTYGHPATREIILQPLAGVLHGQGPMATEALWRAMRVQIRNMGAQGVAAAAVSALDVALWDLKARLLGIPLAALLGFARQEVPIYGSGGFVNYAPERLCAQLGGWVAEQGCRAVKMKIGGDPRTALPRMRIAREAIGDADLMIDSNGACDRKAALAIAQGAAELGVTWYEEPVSSDDLEGLRLLRDRAPAPVEIAAGEYGWEIQHFRGLLQAGAVDVLQADATRCLGYTGFLRAAALAEAACVPISAHTAPALHLPVCCAAPGMRHIEWFHDHVRIEAMLFDGAPEPCGGAIRPDLSRPGHGLAFRRQDAAPFEV